MVRKGRITFINPSTHKNKDVGRLEPFFGKEIHFEAPKNKFSLNDYVEYDMRAGKARVLKRVTAPKNKGRLRKTTKY